jgi:hypothetical protein
MHTAGMSSDLPPSPPSSAPVELAELWSLVLRWGASDDSVREDAIETATDADLRDLVATVSPLLPAINDYLDATGDAEESVPYGDVAQAAMEAKFELKRRTGV